jgi:two-component system, LytTR family, response regulator
MAISCIIIEDEPPAAAKLEGFIKKVSFLNLVAKFQNAIDALPYLRANTVDLIFLDIQMEHLTGIEFLESLTTKLHIIITTAYSEYAIKGYELCVSDYLLKPYSFERFLKAVNKILELSQKETIPVVSNIFVKSGYALENINVDDILYIEGQKEFLQIVTKHKKVMTLMTFNALLDMLPVGKFVRVHKSFVVSISKIENVEHHRIKIAGQLLPIGDSYRESFYKCL